MTCRMKLGICDGDEPHGEEARKKYRPHPEELAKQASRRMDTTHRLPAILRDARKRALLRMRSVFITRSLAGDDGFNHPIRRRQRRKPTPPRSVWAPAA